MCQARVQNKILPHSFTTAGWWVWLEVCYSLKIPELSVLSCHAERVEVIFYQKANISCRMKTIRCFFSPPTSHVSLLEKNEKQLSLQYLRDYGEEAAHCVLVWAKSTLLQQINRSTNRNITPNLGSWRGKKWEQCEEGPAPWSSLKSLSSTHDGADCDCGADGPRTITSDVFMDFQWGPIRKWSCCQCSKMRGVELHYQNSASFHILTREPQSMLSNGSKGICKWTSDLFLLALYGFVFCYCSSRRFMDIIWIFVEKKEENSLALRQLCDCYVWKCGPRGFTLWIINASCFWKIWYLRKIGKRGN